LTNHIYSPHYKRNIEQEAKHIKLCYISDLKKGVHYIIVCWKSCQGSP